MNNRVFVRAIKANGQWGSVDALDLDERSFRAFVLDRLNVAGIVSAVVTEEGDPVVYREKIQSIGPGEIIGPGGYVKP